MKFVITANVDSCFKYETSGESPMQANAIRMAILTELPLLQIGFVQKRTKLVKIYKLTKFFVLIASDMNDLLLFLVKLKFFGTILTFGNHGDLGDHGDFGNHGDIGNLKVMTFDLIIVVFIKQ